MVLWLTMFASLPHRAHVWHGHAQSVLSGGEKPRHDSWYTLGSVLGRVGACWSARERTGAHGSARERTGTCGAGARDRRNGLGGGLGDRLDGLDELPCGTAEVARRPRCFRGDASTTLLCPCPCLLPCLFPCKPWASVEVGPNYRRLVVCGGVWWCGRDGTDSRWRW